MNQKLKIFGVLLLTQTLVMPTPSWANSLTGISQDSSLQQTADPFTDESGSTEAASAPADAYENSSPLSAANELEEPMALMALEAGAVEQSGGEDFPTEPDSEGLQVLKTHSSNNRYESSGLKVDMTKEELSQSCTSLSAKTCSFKAFNGGTKLTMSVVGTDGATLTFTYVRPKSGTSYDLAMETTKTATATTSVSFDLDGNTIGVSVERSDRIFTVKSFPADAAAQGYEHMIKYESITRNPVNKKNIERVTKTDLYNSDVMLGKQISETYVYATKLKTTVENFLRVLPGPSGPITQIGESRTTVYAGTKKITDTNTVYTYGGMGHLEQTSVSGLLNGKTTFINNKYNVAGDLTERVTTITEKLTVTTKIEFFKKEDGFDGTTPFYSSLTIETYSSTKNALGVKKRLSYKSVDEYFSADGKILRRETEFETYNTKENKTLNDKMNEFFDASGKMTEREIVRTSYTYNKLGEQNPPAKIERRYEKFASDKTLAPIITKSSVPATKTAAATTTVTVKVPAGFDPANLQTTLTYQLNNGQTVPVAVKAVKKTAIDTYLVTLGGVPKEAIVVTLSVGVLNDTNTPPLNHTIEISRY